MKPWPWQKGVVSRQVDCIAFSKRFRASAPGRGPGTEDYGNLPSCSDDVIQCF